MLKDYKKSFDFLLEKIKNKENFAFTRFSDGELFILQNKTVVLAQNHYVTGDVKGSNIYTAEEQKEFHPEQHGFYRDKLMESYTHNQDYYYKGICTSTDGHVGKENFDWMIDCHGGDHENLTYANLLINANYKRFIEEMVPLFVDRQILYVVNENANVNKLPFHIDHSFIIGSNCMINNYDTVDEVKNHISKNNIQDAIVLCSAASLTNYVIYECFRNNNNNTFLDIGSCLNPLLDLEGWKHTRGYLTSYWLNSGSPFGRQVDQWG
ncbi:hypothetical protein [Hyphomonas sp.]|uniref:hypothetical protein n=1 Tax=Hyphomonas sp. TaxID=87 RepID=UPI000C944E8E|nr:hypothetical protein [Hyphomonas sp.]MAL45777.1 hypothetical protein [Hyphomonas sp.]